MPSYEKSRLRHIWPNSNPKLKWPTKSPDLVEKAKRSNADLGRHRRVLMRMWMTVVRGSRSSYQHHRRHHCPGVYLQSHKVKVTLKVKLKTLQRYENYIANQAKVTAS